MIATVNLPGSSHFDYFRGTRKGCREWLEQKEEEYQNLFGGAWYGAFSPALIVPEKKARTWRYRDGSRVVPELD